MKSILKYKNTFVKWCYLSLNMTFSNNFTLTNIRKLKNDV